MATPMEECEEFDSKGLYEKGKGGEVGHFAGVEGPDEFPRKPEITVEAGNDSVEGAVDMAMRYLNRKYLRGKW